MRGKKSGHNDGWMFFPSFSFCPLISSRIKGMRRACSLKHPLSILLFFSRLYGEGMCWPIALVAPRFPAAARGHMQKLVAARLPVAVLDLVREGDPCGRDFFFLSRDLKAVSE